MKQYLSCSEVARRLGLSRQRFWQLRKDGVFPEPQVNADTGRPYYTEVQAAVCEDLRRRNVGINGQVVLFYSARSISTVTTPRRRPKKSSKPRTGKYTWLVDAIKGFGLAGVTDSQVSQTVTELFPAGIADLDQAEVVRAVFLQLQRKESCR